MRERSGPHDYMAPGLAIYGWFRLGVLLCYRMYLGRVLSAAPGPIFFFGRMFVKLVFFVHLVFYRGEIAVGRDYDPPLGVHCSLFKFCFFCSKGLTSETLWSIIATDVNID